MSEQAELAQTEHQKAPSQHALSSHGLDADGGGPSLAPPVFQLQAGPQKPAPKQVPPVSPTYYGTQKTNTWVEDKNPDTGDSVVYPNKGDATTRMKYLQSLNEWENLEVKDKMDGGKKVFYVTMQGKRTVKNFTALVKKAEAAYPKYSTDDIVDGIRALAPGYNTNRWRLMLGKKAVAKPIKPVKGKLTQDDIDALKSMVGHSGKTEKDETGIAKDAGGDYVAMGHVLTGVAAGLNRNKKTDLTSGFMESAGGFFGVGEYVDNLYASTIAGDLGQSATIKNNTSGGAKKTTPMIGDNTEATHAELFGDIDGFNIGDAESSKGKHADFSKLLGDYYGGVGKDEKKNRFQEFNKNGKGNLKDQTTRFASNYTYQVNGKGGGLFSEIGTESGYAVDQFNNWTNKEMKSPSKPSTFGKGDGKLKAASGIQLVSDPANYAKTRIAYLDGEAPFKIVDHGKSEPFNKNVQNPAEMGWTKIMVTEGKGTGKIGWVSNRYLNAK